MAKFSRFEDIEAWIKARELSRAIYQATQGGAFARDFALRDQIRRACISVLSNIAEGFERGGDKEFSQFLAIAKGSLGEVRAQLYVALDAGYLNEAQFNQFYALDSEAAKKVSGLMQYLATSTYAGSKYKDMVKDESAEYASKNEQLL